MYSTVLSKTAIFQNDRTSPQETAGTVLRGEWYLYIVSNRNRFLYFYKFEYSQIFCILVEFYGQKVIICRIQKGKCIKGNRKNE